MFSPVNQDIEKAESTLFNRFFRDDKGNIVIAQKPNLPVIVGAVATLLQFVVPSGQLQTGLALVAFGALFTWAWEELFKGVNYFRRSLGLIGLASLLYLGLNAGV